MKIVVRTDLTDLTVGHIDDIRFPEHEHDEDVVLLPIFHTGTLGYFVGVERLQLLPRFFFSGKHLLILHRQALV
jgi:hypothetical protein